MINEENLNKLYNALIEEKELTTKELNSCGFNSRDLSLLVENRILERVKRGYYSIQTIDDLFYFGKKLIAKKEYDKATRCFEKCYELNHDHFGVCFQLFLRSIRNKNYKKAFEYFEHFYNTDNKFYNADNNFYLYLLSMITELPEKFKDYARLLIFEDFKVNPKDKRYKNIYIQNKIRLSVLSQKFILAVKQLNETIKEKGKLSIQDIVIKILLTQAIQVQIKNKNKILELLKKQNYEGLVEFLAGIERNHNLSICDMYIMKLSKTLVDLNKSSNVPQKIVDSTDNLFEAIDGKNYELALEISTFNMHNQNINSNLENDAIHILLENINEKVKELKQGQIENHNLKEDLPKISSNEEKNVASMSTFEDIIRSLTNNDLDNSFIALRNYLGSIDKREYEFLIIDLIKISLLENDIAFTKPMVVLTYISRNDFEFNISEYIQNFYICLSQNHFDQARIYLDIISKSNNLGQECVLTDGLKQILDSTEKKVTHIKDSSVLNRVEQSVIPKTNTPVQAAFESQEKSLQDLNIDKEHNLNQINIDPEVSKSHLKVNSTNDKVDNSINYDDTNFINQKLDILYEKGIVLLKPMNDDRIKGIHEIVKNIPDVISFTISSNNFKQVVLRYRQQLPYEYRDLKKLLKDGKEAYKAKDYNLCISLYREILGVGNPNSFVYAKLGLAYMKKFDTATAIDYLTIATELSKQEDYKYKVDFTDLIASLKGVISEEDRKPQFKMTISDFKNDVEEYYGINNIDKIAEQVSLGYSVNEACQIVGVDSDQVGIVTLIFARECYLKGNYLLGDKYIKQVEKMKNKSTFIISLLDEIRRNKKFYKNRVSENHKALVLTSKC